MADSTRAYHKTTFDGEPVVMAGDSDIKGPTVCCCSPHYGFYIACALVALVEFIWACVLGHVFGITLGVVAIAVIVLNGFATVKWQPTTGVRVLNSICCGFAALFTTWMVFLILVRGWSASPPGGRFDLALPNSCRLPDGCTRVAFANFTLHQTGDHRCGDVCRVPQLQSDIAMLQDSLVSYFDSTFQTRVLLNKPGYVHARKLSFMWGFPDDIGVELYCNNTLATLAIQSEQRVGTSDNNVNLHHVQDLVAYVDNLSTTHGACPA